MRKVLRFSIGTGVAAAALFAAAAVAEADTPYDGAWTVSIATSRGACSSGSSFTLQVRNGVVSGSGGFAVGGNVSRNGSVCVRVGGSGQYASGCGRLSRSSGGGSWSGVGSQGRCSGRWTASR
jgi:hypothetical protein